MADVIHISAKDISRFYYCEFYAQFRKIFYDDIRAKEDKQIANMNGDGAHQSLLNLQLPEDFAETVERAVPQEVGFEDTVSNEIDFRKINPVQESGHDNIDIMLKTPIIKKVGGDLPKDGSIRIIQEPQSISTKCNVRGERYMVHGTPDLVVFNGEKPILIAEYKFTANEKDIKMIRKHESIQPRVYGWIMKNNGFDVSDLYYTVIKSSMGCHSCDKLLTPVQLFIENSLDNYKKCPCPPEDDHKMVASTNKYTQQATNGHIRSALPVIAALKMAEPTKDTIKCRSCTINSQCAHYEQPTQK